MQDQNLFLRNDTFLGACEAIGSDFGFHPNLLRVALAVALFFSPAVTVGVYLALGVAVALARWIYPARAAQAAIPAQPREAVAAHSNDEQQDLPLAA